MQNPIAELQESTIVQQQEPLWNVPTPLTSLIGREEEVTSICALLSNPEVRLLTLLGPGGVGKTRLSIEVATHLRATFADGVCFVNLAAINDPAQVLLSIAQALHIPEMETRPLLHLVMASLRKKQILLLLDNFEQVLMAAQVLSDILEACPEVKMLITSRAALRIQSEQEFLVQPLALPPLSQLPGHAALARYAAVALFLQRVQAQIPSFQITPANAQAIAEICVRLDGLPLAVELAAARIKLLPPLALLARLSPRLQLLTDGPRTLPMRQRTLRNTLKWSYDLLSASEQQLFRRISVFVGGCSLEAIEALYAEPGDDAGQVLDAVASLIDKSMLQQTEQEGNEPRLLMLETIREYGLERLAESEEAEAMHRAHAAYFLALVEKVEPELEGPQQAAWMKQLEQEHDNLRAVLLWAVAQVEEKDEQEGREIALRLTVALRRFWLVRGYISEGQHFLERALAKSEGTATLIYAKALLLLGMLVSIQGDHSRAEALCTESLELFRKLKDPRSSASALYQLGRLAWMRGDLKQARSLAEDALVYSRESGHKGSIAWSLFRLARLVIEQGEYARGRALLEENLVLHRKMGNKRAIAAALYHLAWVHLITQSEPDVVRSQIARALTLFKEVGDKEGIAYSFYLSGRLAFSQDNIAAARLHLQESEALFRTMLHQEGVAWALSMLGRVATIQADYKAAHSLYKESLEIARKLDYKGVLAFCLEGFAAMIAAQEAQNRGEAGGDEKLSGPRTTDEEALSNTCWAVQLWGAAEALRDTTSLPIVPADRAAYECSVAVARKLLGEESFAAAWAEGRAMSPVQALSAQGRRSIPVQPSKTGQATSSKMPLLAGLTARELEVLCLVAQGMTSAQIAERLTLSLLTVNTYVRSIYSKLGVTSRSGATRYAIEHKLV